MENKLQLAIMSVLIHYRNFLKIVGFILYTRIILHISNLVDFSYQRFLKIFDFIFITGITIYMLNLSHFHYQLIKNGIETTGTVKTVHNYTIKNSKLLI